MSGGKAVWMATTVVFAILSQSRADHHGFSTVPPGDEIEILDPHVDSRGLPRAMLVPDNPDYPSRVDVPPMVIHHRYYFTGERDFQGPMLPGGPSIIIVNHPETGEQMMISAQLMPGAPRIYYCNDEIRYDYGDAVITLDFDDVDEPEVEVSDRSPFHRRIRAAATGAKAHCRQWVERTGVPHAVEHVAHGTAATLDTGADRIHDLGQTVTAPFVQIWESTPLGSLFMSSAEERAIRERDAAVQRVGTIADEFAETIPTLR